VIRRKTNRRHMTGDHHGRTTGRATLLVTATDEILGTHTCYAVVAEAPTRGSAGPVSLAGFHDGFLAAAAVAILALAVAWPVRDADAAPTMIRRGPAPGRPGAGGTPAPGTASPAVASADPGR
jgi:hypothetical protein